MKITKEFISERTDIYLGTVTLQADHVRELLDKIEKLEREIRGLEKSLDNITHPAGSLGWG